MKLLSPLPLVMLLAVSLCSQVQAARVSGAIFTTTVDGTVVNENNYASKCDVYLDGGPGPNAPAKAAGLPDGLYYFQVTDPSGKTLLSTDPVSNRQFQVMGGVIVAYWGSLGEPPHPTGADQDHGAVTISLANETCPNDYLDTTNGGGVYKVWATPAVDFVGDVAQVDNDCGKGCFHGFLPSKSKTDNFKVQPLTSSPTFCLTIGKELGELGSTPGVGWEIIVTDPFGTENHYFMGPGGQAQVCDLTEGDYVVTEATDPIRPFLLLFVNGVITLRAPDPPTYPFTWSSGDGDMLIVFRNGGFEGDS